MESSQRGTTAGAALAIGRMSRASGLTVSALRFYDGADVLVPAHVDPQTGYRYYAPGQVRTARLVAVLRRVGMPLACIREVLAHRSDPAAVDRLLAAHLRRLEQGLADARRELSSVRTLVEQEEHPVPTTVTVRGAELADALRAVRFAVGSDPDLPVLSGVLLDVTADAVTLVATDRYRLAAASVPVAGLAGPPVGAVVPADLADRIPAAELVEITLDGREAGIRAGSAELRGTLITEAFPDYRRLLPETGSAGALPVGRALRDAVAAAPVTTMTRETDGAEYEVAVLAVGPDGVTVGAGDGAGDTVAVNREFLLQALDAGGPGQLELRLDGPIAPLVIRSPRSVSLLMPVRP